MQIMEYTFNEGHDKLELVMDKFPMDATEVQLRRMWQTVDAIASGTSAMTPSAGSGIIYDSAYGAPAMVTAYSGFQAVDSTHNLRMRFTLPKGLAMVQTVTLSIFLMGFRSGLQQTAQTNLSAAGSAHNHGSVTTGTDNVNHIHGNPNSYAENANHAHGAGGENTNHSHNQDILFTTGGGYSVQINYAGGFHLDRGDGPHPRHRHGERGPHPRHCRNRRLLGCSPPCRRHQQRGEPQPHHPGAEPQQPQRPLRDGPRAERGGHHRRAQP
jgi:hypothetical protein